MTSPDPASSPGPGGGGDGPHLGWIAAVLIVAAVAVAMWLLLPTG